MNRVTRFHYSPRSSSIRRVYAMNSQLVGDIFQGLNTLLIGLVISFVRHDVEPCNWRKEVRIAAKLLRAVSPPGTN